MFRSAVKMRWEHIIITGARVNARAAVNMSAWFQYEIFSPDFKFFGRERLTEYIALDIIAPHLTQKLDLFLGINTLGNDLVLQQMCQRDNG